MELIFKEIKHILFAVFWPCLGFMLGMFLSLFVAPDDLELSGYIIIISSYIGVIIAIFLILRRIKYWFKIVLDIVYRKYFNK